MKMDNMSLVADEALGTYHYFGPIHLDERIVAEVKEIMMFKDLNDKHNLYSG